MQPSISVVCATKNEKHEIYPLIDSFVSCCPSDAELLIIDDSTDGQSFSLIYDKVANVPKKINIRLIKGDSTGCCNARNLGIKIAKNNYICFMTADSFFPDDFFQNAEVAITQNNGPDLITTTSIVANQSSLFADFIHCCNLHKLQQNEHFTPLTSQGYMVKRDIAIKVNMIDEYFIPFNVCRDRSLAQKIDSLNGTRLAPSDLVCYHNAPATRVEFINTHVTRGVISAGTAIYIDNRGRLSFIAYSLSKTIVGLLKSILFGFPKATQRASFSKFSRTASQYYWLESLRQVCFSYGEIKGVWLSLSLINTVKHP